MNKLPKAKTDNLVVQNLGDEFLIYNLSENKVYCLNQTSAVVYIACDGNTTFAEFESKSGLSEDLIHLTLAELERNNFIEMPSEYISTLNGMSRREAVKKVGLATMIALPLIMSVAAPAAANAASACETLSMSCLPDINRQSNCCDGLRCNVSSTCTTCIQTGLAYPGSNVRPSYHDYCPSADERNLCCNPGLGIPAETIGNYFCVCP